MIATHIDQARAALEAARAEYALQKAEAQRQLNAATAMAGAQPEGWGADGIAQAAEDLEGVNAYWLSEIEQSEAQLVRYSKMLEGFTRSQFPSQGTGSGTGTAPTATSETLESTPAKTTEKFRLELEALIDKLDPASAKAKMMARDHATLAAALIKGEISLEQYNSRMDQLKEHYANLPASTSAASAGIKALNDEIDKNPAAKMADEVGGAVGNLISRIDSGKDALKQFGLELVKIFAVRGISKLLGGDNWFSGPLIGTNALGTDNWRGGLSWVGEKGPELVNLPMGAQVIPNSKIGGMGGGGMNFTYAPNIDARGASVQAVQELEQRMRADGVQFNAKVEQAVMQAEEKRRLR